MTSISDDPDLTRNETQTTREHGSREEPCRTESFQRTPRTVLTKYTCTEAGKEGEVHTHRGREGGEELRREQHSYNTLKKMRCNANKMASE